MPLMMKNLGGVFDANWHQGCPIHQTMEDQAGIFHAHGQGMAPDLRFGVAAQARGLSMRRSS